VSARRGSHLAGTGVIGRLGRRRDERGAMLVLAAAGLVLAMIFAALAIDIGFLAADKRTDQKLADLAALDASRDLTNVQARADASVARNYNSQRDAVPTTFAERVRKDPVSGDYVADPTGKFVRVTVTSPRKPFFPFVSSASRTVKAVAVAGSQPEAEFSVGSSLASLDTQKSALDNIIGPMLGGVNMSAVSYSGLASGDVGLRLLQQKLLDMGWDVGTTDKLLNTELDVADLLEASGQVLTAQGDFVAAGEINDIPFNLIPNLETVTLGDLVGVSQPGADSALDTSINAFELVKGAAQVANGDNFVAVPGINCGGLLASVTSCAVSLHVIEPAQTRRGPVGTVATTSQVALRIELNLLPILGNAVMARLNFTAGSGYGELTDINCSATPGISIFTHTSGAGILGRIAAGGILAPVGYVDLAGNVNGAPDTTVSFSYPSQFVNPAGGGGNPAFSREVGVANLGLAPTTLGVSGSGGLLGALLTPLEPVVETALTTLNSLLVPTLGPILSVLGVDVAGATITAREIYDPPPACGSTRLVK
jgi:uncharacterized membrane protein